MTRIRTDSAGRKAAAVIGMGVLVALAIAPASPASTQTAGGIKYVVSKTKAPGGRSTATARCPRHTRVLGGGEINNAGYGSIILDQSFPFDGGDADHKPDDGWRVRVKNASSGKLAIQVQANCGHTKVSYRKRSFDIGAGEEGDEYKDCPAGEFAYAGGIGGSAHATFFLNSTFPSPGGTGSSEWGGYVDAPQKSTATLYAICGKAEPIIVEATLSSITIGTQGSIDASCPPGRHGYGGGLGTTAGYQDLAINSLAGVSVGGTPGAGWLTSADVIGPYAPDVTVSAVCGKSLN